MEFFSDVRDYLSINGDDVLESLIQHTWLALLPVLIGFVVALPLGWLVASVRQLRVVLLAVSSIVYTIPSLALILVLPAILGTGILDPLNVVVALTIYTVALMMRTVADGLESVDASIVQAATAMGYKPVRRWFAVELPLALPVIFSGVRVATVTNVSLVSVAALIGVANLGSLFTRGARLGFYAPPIVIGLVLSVLLAFAADAIIVAIQRWATRWDRIGASR